MTPLEFYLSLGMFAASLIILALRGGAKEMFKRKQQIAELVQESAEVAHARRIAEALLEDDRTLVYTHGVPRSIGKGLIGYFMLVGSGTYGQNMLMRVLVLLYLCGLERLIGSILLIQHNASEREAFKSSVPSCYHERITYGYSSLWSGGIANRPTEDVLDCVDEWAGNLRRAADDATYAHERTTGRVPGQIIFFWSEGGQAPVALPVLQVISERFPRAQIVGMTSLPRSSRNRRKFVELKGKYDAYVAGWVVSDELQPDWRNADYGMAALLVALSDAQLHDDETTQLNNVLALAFTQEPGSVLALHYTHDRIVATPWEVDGEVLGYSMDTQRVVSSVQSALRTIEQGKGINSVIATLGEPDTAVFDIVMVSVGVDTRHERDDLQVVSDRIDEGYRERLAHLSVNGGRAGQPGLLYGLSDYALKFGSLATVVDPGRPSGQVLAVRLAAIKNGARIAEQIAAIPEALRLPHDRPLRALPASSGEPKRAGRPRRKEGGQS